MTPAQAVNMWCPFARVADPAEIRSRPSVNRAQNGEPLQTCKCIAQRCMLWRWKREPKEKHGEQPVPINELDAYEREQARKRGDAFVVKDFGPPDEGDGFCGMAPRN